MKNFTKYIVALLCFFCVCLAEDGGVFSSLSPEDKPFRMQKLNIVWQKAQKKFPKEKLKTLYTDLKYQDKEEIAWKKQKAEGLDKKDGREKLIQASFDAILKKYGLSMEFRAIENSILLSSDGKEEDTHFKHVFRDKKLNKLWLKAEKQGFSVNELEALKEEFEHHQKKVDQYFETMEKVSRGPWDKNDPSNNIEQLMVTEGGKKPKKEINNPHQMLKAKNSELKEGYDYLTSRVVNQKRPEFDEPQVQSLWELSKNGSFTDAELKSLKEELHHFEHRVRKLKFMTHDMNEEALDNVMEEDLNKHLKKLKHFNHKVEKTKKEIESRIMARHTEL